MKKVVIILTIISVFFTLTACEMSFHHFKFEIEGLEKLEPQEYLKEDIAESIKVNGVAFYHYIGATTHTQYTVYIESITDNKDAEIIVKSFVLSEKESKEIVLSDTDLNSKISLELDEKTNLYEGSLVVGQLPSPDYLPNYVLSNDIEFILQLEVEVITEEKSEVGNIEYTIIPVAYFGGPDALSV